MKISIVTPVFNDVQVCRALDSVLAQHFDCELETIVVDAGSTDGTLAELERYADQLTACISEPDGGAYDGMNKGIGYATGDVIGILNADDKNIGTGVLQDVVDAFRHHSEAEVCYGAVVQANKSDKFVRRVRPGVNRKFKWYFGWRPPHSSFFVRSRTYYSYGLFSLDYRVASDYELQLRLLFIHGLQSIYIDRPLVEVAPRSSSRSAGKSLNGSWECLRAWRQHGSWGGMLVPFLNPICKISQSIGSIGSSKSQRA